MATGIEHHVKLWQPPIEPRFIYFVNFSCAADYTAKKLKACVESNSSILERLLEEKQDGIIAAGMAPTIIKHISLMKKNQPYIVEYCSRILVYTGQALNALEVSYIVKMEKPKVTVLTLQTPLGEADVPVKLTPKPTVKDPMLRHPLEVQAFYADLKLLLEGMESTEHVVAKHVTSRQGPAALMALESAKEVLYKPYNL